MIKASLLSLALMTTVIGPAHSKLKTFNPLEGHPQISSEAVKDVYTGVKFNYLDREDRILIVEDFLRTVELEYALLPLKKERIGLNFKKLKEEAISVENLVDEVKLQDFERNDTGAKNTIALAQANSNLEFYDRMHALIAKFQDTHFSFQEKVTRPFVYTGMRVYRIQGKIVVGSLEKKFLSMAGKLSNTDFSTIKIGDEVLEIDGVPVEQKINEQKVFISASSEEFRDYQAIRSLTLRSVNYDKKNYIKIKFKNAGLMKLPLFANIVPGSTPRLDAVTFFKEYGIPSDATSIGMVFDKASNTWNDSAINFEGYTITKLHLNLKGLIEYADDSGAAGLRTGYYMNKGKTYGVLQILTFSTKNLKNGTTALPFIDTIRNFITEMKENELPLIIDLRVNGGGNGNFPGQVLSLLAEDGVIYPGPTSGYRMTYYMRQVQEPSLYQEIVGEDQSVGLSADQFKDIFDNTIANRLEYSPMMAFSPLPFDAKVKGFSNKIVALITGSCISACDKMSFLLKSSKRATIIGTTSNGTGAGYLSTSELNTQWQDPLRVLSTQVPNYLFGLPGASFDQVVFGEGSISKMCTENKPTIADVQYSPTMVDLSRNSLGWLQKAAQVLEGEIK